MRTKKIIAGNWKMNKLPNETIDFISTLEPLVKDSPDEVILCVPFIDLFYANSIAQNTNIHIGAQNMHWEESGAYTGEVSGEMLAKIKTEYVIIGHSERRQYFAETDDTVNRKIKAALSYGLKPIVCVGETLEQREEGEAEEVLRKQTKLALEGLTGEQVSNIIIAYEPIWAIGTGKTATSEDANESIKQIRDEVKKIYGEEVSSNIYILYGGSVKPENSKELFSTSDIDGALIGGASLDVDKFSKIVNFND
jgi:triosephosphate isomerase